MEPNALQSLARRIGADRSLAKIVFDEEDKDCPAHQCVLCWSRRPAEESDTRATTACYLCGIRICSPELTGMGGCDRCSYRSEYVEKWLKRQPKSKQQELSRAIDMEDESRKTICAILEDITKPAAEPEDEPPVCVVCLERPPDTLVLPCMHQVCCRKCSDELAKTPNAQSCVMCRTAITNVFADNASEKSY